MSNWLPVQFCSSLRLPQILFLRSMILFGRIKKLNGMDMFGLGPLIKRDSMSFISFLYLESCSSSRLISFKLLFSPLCLCMFRQNEGLVYDKRLLLQNFDIIGKHVCYVTSLLGASVQVSSPFSASLISLYNGLKHTSLSYKDFCLQYN